MCFSDSSSVTSTDSNDSSCGYSYCNDNKINLVQTSSDTATTSSTRPHLSTERGGNSQHYQDSAGKPNFLDELTFGNVVFLLSLISLLIIFSALYFIEPYLCTWLPMCQS